jgi:DNA-binding SARP family transcriptional activator
VLEYEILGPLRVRSADGEIVMRGARRRALLVRLLVSANREVPTDRLSEDLWEGDPPPGAASTLQSHVSFLRRTLGGSSLDHRSGGYMLSVEDEGYDIRQFELDSQQGLWALDEGELEEAELHLGRALSRWRGDPLADANRAAWALPEIGRLEELRLNTGETWHDVLLALGRPEEVIASAEVILAAQHWRERLWGQLMLALYRTGRQAEALRTFQRFREELGSELGIEPTRELMDLEEAILLQKPELDLVAAARHGLSASTRQAADSMAAGVPLPDRLRESPSVYVGREEERALLDEAFKGARSDGLPRIALVSGEPGIGKTSLASVVAQGAHRAGAAVLYGRCDRDLGIPYQPWREAVGHLVKHAPQPMREAVAEKASMLRTFGLTESVDASPVPVVLPPRPARLPIRPAPR